MGNLAVLMVEFRGAEAAERRCDNLLRKIQRLKDWVKSYESDVEFGGIGVYHGKLEAIDFYEHLRTDMLTEKRGWTDRLTVERNRLISVGLPILVNTELTQVKVLKEMGWDGHVVIPQNRAWLRDAARELYIAYVDMD